MIFMEIAGRKNAPQGGPAPSLTFNPANNQASQFSYDAAGNLTSDGINSYQYDAEGNVLSSSASNVTMSTT